jgi:hypothetical protein
MLEVEQRTRALSMPAPDPANLAAALETSRKTMIQLNPPGTFQIPTASRHL